MTKGKFVVLILIFVFSIGMITVQSFADNTNADIITTTDGYTFNTVKGIITDYSGDGGDIEIPSQINGIKVIGIGQSAFFGCTSLTGIIIPNSVTSIGIFAFFDCTSLTGIIIPDSVTSIGNNAFTNCKGLTSITIPGSVKSISNSLLSNCTSLADVTIQNGTSIIDSYAFSDCTSLLSVTIPNSVTNIGYSAFSYTGLLSITIPSSVTSIGDSAFLGCTNLTGINIPESVSQIGINVFNGCSKLTSINVDAANTNFSSINGVLFDKAKTTLLRYPEGITASSYDIPNSVTRIGESAFSGCSKLTGINIPESVNSIGDYSFAYCSGLSSIAIPKSVNSIGNFSFTDCSRLSSITIPEGVNSMGESIFMNCVGLFHVIFLGDQPSDFNSPFNGINRYTEITVPLNAKGYGKPNPYNNEATWRWYQDGNDGVIRLKISTTVSTIVLEGDFVFNVTTGIILGYKGNGGNVIIPDIINDTVVTGIGERAFASCKEITGITIPESVNSVGDYAFGDCSGLTSIPLPDCLTSIGNSAFAACSGLTSITLPDCLTSIGDSAFYGCKEITGINIPEGVTSIGDATFSNCSGLTSITLPDRLTSIGNYAFSSCGLSDITIPEGVTRIGSCVFYCCKELIKIKFLGNEPSSINLMTFDQTFEYLEITVPSNAIGFGKPNPYNNETSWIWHFGSNSYKVITAESSLVFDGDFIFDSSTGTILRYRGLGGDVRIPVTINGVEVTGIGNGAFKDCIGLTGISIPEAVTGIGLRAFYGCSGLKSITIPEGVTRIEGWAFYGCSGLTGLSIPKGVSIIGEYAFLGCRGLTSITIPEGVTSIGNSAFAGCSGLTSITIPKGVNRIGYHTFEYCRGLTSVSIPEGVAAIESYAFSDCSGLTSITIPKSVTVIGGAFHRCSELSNAIFLGNQPSFFVESAFLGTKDDFKITISPAATGFGKPNPYNNETTWDWSPTNRYTYKVVISGKYNISGFISPDFNDINNQSALKEGFEVEVVGANIKAATNADGYFELLNIPENTNGYTVRISKPGYLYRDIKISKMNNWSINIGSEDNPVSLWAGDINNDTVINMSDVVKIAKVYNTNSASGNFINDYDFNKDNVINLIDIMIMSKHFNRKADDYIPIIL